MSVPTTKARLCKSEVENLVKKNQSLSYVKFSSTESLFWNKFQEILVHNVRQRFTICNDYRSVLTWTSSNGTNVMKKHSTSCIKAKDLTPETQPHITSLFKETYQVTPEQFRFFKNKFFMMLLKWAY